LELEDLQETFQKQVLTTALMVTSYCKVNYSKYHLFRGTVQNLDSGLWTGPWTRLWTQ